MKKKKLDERKLLNYKNQKELYQKLVVEPVNKVLLEMNGNTSFTFCKEGIINVNKRVKELVTDSWSNLTNSNRLRLPHELVSVEFRESNDNEGVFDLHLSDSLVSLLYGKLDTTLVPIKED